MKIFAAALCAILAVSVAGNLLLLKKARFYYQQSAQVALDPIGLNRFEPSIAGRIVFFGDSRIAEWPDDLTAEFDSALNRGISGQTTEQCVHRLEAHVLSAMPDTIVIQMGVNDLKAIPLFPGRREEIVRNCLQNIRQITAVSRSRGASVVLLSIFPLGEVPLQRRMVWSDDVALAIEEVNRELLAMEGEGIQVIDVTPLLADADGGMRGEFSRDLLHMTEAGYQALMPTLTEVLGGGG